MNSCDSDVFWYSGTENEEVQMPVTVDPQHVRVMLPHDPENRPAVSARATYSAGVAQGQAPGESSY